MSEKQKTIALIKSGAVSRGLSGAIIQAILDGTAVKGGERQTQSKIAIDLAVSKRLPRAVAEEFYAEHAGRPYFECLIDSVTSDNVIILVLSGDTVIKDWRTLLGTTNPVVARQNGEQGIRALYGTENPGNADHGSDSPESFLREYAILKPLLDE